MIRVKENSVSPGKNRDYPGRKYRFTFLILYGKIVPDLCFFLEGKIVHQGEDFNPPLTPCEKSEGKKNYTCVHPCP